MHWKQRIDHWLRAERDNHVAAAEEALVEVFRALSDPRVRTGFAGAVLRRIDSRPVPSVFPRSARWAVGVAMVAAACSMAMMPLVLALLSGVLQPASLVEFAGALLLGASRALTSGLALWESLAAVNRILFGILSQPRVALAMVGVLGISVVGFRLFSSLMTSDRSTGYAQ